MKGWGGGSVLWSLQTLFDAGSATGMTDRQLLEQFLARQAPAAEAAFAALVAQHGPMVWNVCRGVLADSHAAEDAFQATFLILVRKASSIRRRETVGAWLFGVARRVAVRAKANMARQRKRECPNEETKAASVSPPARQEEIDTLHQEIDRLPEKYRAVVVLCHLEGRTHAEAARLLKCPTGTISVRAARARELLRGRLTRRGVAFPAALVGIALADPSARAAIPVGLAESTIKAAVYLADGNAMTARAVPAAVMQLTDGVLRTMTLNKLTITGACMLVAGIAASSIGLLARGQQSAQDKPGAPAATATKADAAEQKARRQSNHNLRVISLAIYHAMSSNSQVPFPLTAKIKSRFPTAAISKDGKPLLSWRVALLPFLGEKGLYAKFHLDEPWDSANNKPLLDQMPSVYAPVLRRGESKDSTYYQVLVGRGALFADDQGTLYDDVTDPRSQTLMVVEGAKPVPWTKPEDIPFDSDPEKPLPKLGGQFEDGFHVAFADGSVLFLSKSIDPDTLRGLITRNGGEEIKSERLAPKDPQRKN